jgi:hypothetical protein
VRVLLRVRVAAGLGWPRGLYFGTCHVLEALDDSAKTRWDDEELD